METAKALTDKITAHIQELADATDVARLSEEMTKYLETASRFHHYSVFNTWQILASKPNASTVAGFHKWNELGRWVIKGEHGIPILAPIFKTTQDEAGETRKELVYFKVVYVFDVSQTDGDPLPEPPNWKSPEKNQELHDKLVAYATSQGINVDVAVLGNDTQGVSCGGNIVVDPQAGTKTLIHEIAHELLHQRNKEQAVHVNRELEAESVAYVVAKHFGITDLASPNYVALHGATATSIIAHLERIRKTAIEIINALDTSPAPVL